MDIPQEASQNTEPQFFVPDSQKHDKGVNHQLPFLRSSPELFPEEREGLRSMASNKEGRHSLFGESEVETNQPEALATDTASDNGDNSSKEGDKNITVIHRSSPSKTWASLHLSGDAMLVPETMESLNEVPASPDVFDPQPTIVPDSPTDDHGGGNVSPAPGTVGDCSEETRKSEGEDQDEEVSFKPQSISTLHENENVLKAATQQSIGVIESQNFHLHLTQSQDLCTPRHGDEEEDPSLILDQQPKDPFAIATLEASEQHTSVRSPHKMIALATLGKSAFSLHTPSQDKSVAPDVEQEVSIFKRVKSGLSSPHKVRRLDDSEDVHTTKQQVSFHVHENPAVAKSNTPGSSTSKRKTETQKKRKGNLFDESESVASGSSKIDDGKERFGQGVQKPAANNEVVKPKESQGCADPEETLTYSFQAEPSVPLQAAASYQADGFPHLSDSSSDNFILSQKKGLPKAITEPEIVANDSVSVTANTRVDDSSHIKESVPDESEMKEQKEKDIQGNESSLTKSQILSPGSTMAHSVSLDPYTFMETQSQVDVPPLPLSDSLHTSIKKKKPVIKTMRKVLRKRGQPQESHKSSSSETNVAKDAKSRQQRKRKINQQQTTTTLLQASRQAPIGTTDFVRPLDQTGTHSALKDVSIGTGHGQTRKEATVSFSNNAQIPAMESAVPDKCDLVEYTVKLCKITTMKLKSPHGEVKEITEKQEILDTIQYEVLVKPQDGTSPSRSVNTMTSGDLGDISSSSLSRQLSSGSKTSLEMAPSTQSLQGQQLKTTSKVVEAQFGEVEAEVRTPPATSGVQRAASTNSVPPLVNVSSKRSSAGSSAGQDLFATPNQSIINPADSQLGKVLSSSHSFTPEYHQSSLTPPPGQVQPDKSNLTSPSEDLDKDRFSTASSSSNKQPQKKKSTGLVPSLVSEGASREEAGELNDLRSTGFSIHGVPWSTASGDSGAPSPKPSTRGSTQISQQGPVHTDQPAPCCLSDYKSKPVIGAKVMGKWMDGYFYPGLLNQIVPGKRAQVQFDDGSQRSVRPQEVVLACGFPVGQSVMVLDNDGSYLPGMVMGHSKDLEGTTFHQVERDDGVTQRSEWSNIILSEDQAACLLSDEELRLSADVDVPQPTTSKASISLDNLVEGKRQSRHTILAEEASTSGQKRKLGPVLTSTPTPKIARRKNPGSTSGKDVDTVKSSPAEARRSPRKARQGHLAKFPPANPKLFEGMVFMLTHTEKSAELRAYEKQLLQGSSLDTSTDENTDIELDIPCFDKEQIQALIKQSGGTILGSLDTETIKSSRQCLVIAAEHQRTLKYMQALAAGVKVVSHQWVIVSVQQNRAQAVEAYTLPAGISFDTRRIVEGVQGCPELSKKTVLVVSSNKDFVEGWTIVLHLAGSNVISKFPPRASKAAPGVDLVVSDPTCPVTISRRCAQLNVKLVSSEWLSQSLISGRLVDSTAHPSYKHDFVQGEISPKMP